MFSHTPRSALRVVAFFGEPRSACSNRSDRGWFSTAEGLISRDTPTRRIPGADQGDSNPLAKMRSADTVTVTVACVKLPWRSLAQ